MEKSEENTLTKLDGRKSNGLYRGTDAVKAATIGSIVKNGLESLALSLDRSPVDPDDLGEIRRRTVEYVQKRIQDKYLPTVEGWAVALGISRWTLYSWMKLSNRKELSDYLVRVREAFSDMHETAALGNCVNPVAWIFISKNHFDYADKSEIVITPNKDPLGDLHQLSPEELQKKYMDAIVVDDLPATVQE